MEEFDFDHTYELVHGPYRSIFDDLRKLLYEHDPRLRYGDNTPNKYSDDLSLCEWDWIRWRKGAYVNGEWWGWPKITAFVIARDKKCIVCGDDDFEHLEGGHIISRMYGGSDHPDNIVAMCVVCNHRINPEHETAESFWNWVATKPHEKYYLELAERLGLEK